MEAVSTLVRVSFPNYLRNLPIPSSLGGFSKLSATDWLSLVPFVGTVSLLVYVTVQAFNPNLHKPKRIVNPNIKKESSKVVDMEDIEDLGEKVAYCRCWRSKKFPYCDGSHGKHNTETGDNCGPLVLKRRGK